MKNIWLIIFVIIWTIFAGSVLYTIVSHGCDEVQKNLITNDSVHTAFIDESGVNYIHLSKDDTTVQNNDGVRVTNIHFGGWE